MADNSVEEGMLNLIEEVCDDDVIREERDIDLFEAGLLDSMAAIELLVGIETESSALKLHRPPLSARR